MATLADFFNPTNFMFLGILVLVVAVLVVYFESKMRDQNHKIASMLSLVSTLAEDMNGVKMGLNQLAITRIGGSTSQNYQQPLENPIITQPNKLIDVSDDEEDDDDDDDHDEEEEDDEEDDEDDEDDDDEDDEHDEEEDTDEEEDEDNNDDTDDDKNETEDETVLEIDEDGDDDKTDYIKVLKIDLKQNTDYELSESNNLVLESLDDLDDEESSHQLSSIEINNKSNLKPDDFSSAQYEEKVNDDLDISSSIFKSIKINLEDSYSDSLDYKKLPLPKLRSIVTEKGLVTDTSKLKKNELLKLLGVE